MKKSVGCFNIVNSLILSLIVILGLNGAGLAADPEKVDAGIRREVVQKVALFMEDFYVFPEVGEKMGEHILKRERDGNYDGLDEVKEFCGRVTSDLRDICHDKHIFVFYSPEEARDVAARNGLLPQEEIEKINKEQFEKDQAANFGFSAVDILDGNIGFLKLDYFSGSDEACRKAVDAVNDLAGTDAMIIDLRDNRGGGGGVGEVLSSYFFNSKKVQLTGSYYRRTDSINQSWTLPYLPGKRLPYIDLYILTGKRTFSAGEDFSYSLKHLGRATIVGKKTKGGAHPVDVLIVHGAILTQISIGNSVNPVTGTNWEETGVIPDVEVEEEQALHTAHLMALKKVMERTVEGKKKNNLGALIKWMER